MPSTKVDPGSLSGQAWEMIQEAMTTGNMTLPGADGRSPKTLSLDAKTFVDLVKWLANLSKRKDYVKKPEDFNLKKTSGG